jgi:serine protease inhibitor
MVVDRPFAFAIVDTRTGLPLFEGRVADPTAK